MKKILNLRSASQQPKSDTVKEIDAAEIYKMK
jgi:hypothetical protein